MMDGRDGAGFIIRGLDPRLIVTSGDLYAQSRVEDDLGGDLLCKINSLNRSFDYGGRLFYYCGLVASIP